MWYFRDVLVLPDVRAAMQQNKSVAEQKKTRQGFFKRLFGKKDKTKKTTDSVQVDIPASDTIAVKQKKSFNPFKKKASKAKSIDPKKKADPAKKEDDDGF